MNYTSDIQLHTKTNETVYVNVSGSHISINGKMHYYFSLRNITRRIQHAAALKQSEKKFRALTENSPDHILRVAEDGALLFCNPSFLNEYGLLLSDTIGLTITQLSSIPHKLKLELSQACKQVVVSKTTASIEVEFTRKRISYAFDWTITPEMDEQQNLVSLLLVGRNFSLRKQAEQELVIAKEKAVGADRLKSAFLANMSHEIRTPLNAIVGFSNLLKEKTLSDKERSEFIDIISNSSDNLLTLINDIVDLAKIESGHFTVSSDKVKPKIVLVELYKLFEKKIALEYGNSLKLTLNLPEGNDLHTTFVDKNRLRQIFINLIGNAVKFTQKGEVEFGYTICTNKIRFFVRDTGIGIQNDKHDIIFNPFRQEHENTSKLYGGTGLGLAICKRLLIAMDSKIQLISEKGMGSEFFFYLPLLEP